MLLKLDTAKYHTIYELEGIDEFPLIHAVVLGKQAGFVFVDKDEEPSVVFVMHKSGFARVFTVTSLLDINAFSAFIREEDSIPQYFHLYKPAQELIDMVGNELIFGFKNRERVQLRYTGNDKLSINLADDYKMVDINKDNIALVEVMGLDLGSRFWNSTEDFLMNGYGVLLTYNDAPVSICYTACVSDKFAEVDILTIPEFRKKGLGKYVTAGYINRSIEKSIVPNWDCFIDNYGSLNIAQACGFTVQCNYCFLSIFKKS